MRSFAPKADFGTNRGAAASTPAARKSLRSIKLLGFLLSSSNDTRWIPCLSNHPVCDNPEIDGFDEFRDALFHLSPPKRGSQLTGNAIKLVENLCVLPDHHQCERATPAEHAMDLEQSPHDVVSRQQFQQET